MSETMNGLVRFGVLVFLWRKLGPPKHQGTKWQVFFFIFLFFYAAMFSVAGYSQTIPNDNMVYKPYIKTVLLHKAGFEMSAPVIVLNSSEKL